MEQQIIIELMQLLGSQSVDFSGDPLRVKMSPHTPPQVITRAMVDNRVVQCEVDGVVAEFNKLSEPVRNTIGQRLRLMLAQTKKRLTFNLTDMTYGYEAVHPDTKENPQFSFQQYGLTKREYFAAMAMQGYCGGEFTGQSGKPHKDMAEWSVEMADALIEALNKPKNKEENTGPKTFEEAWSGV